MESLFSFNDYRVYVREAIAAQPHQGYGASGRLARAMGVHPSFVSQVLAGGKHLNQDQALLAAGFLGFSELETDYFSLLVQRERAVTQALRAHLDAKVAELKEKSRRLVNRVGAKSVLSEEARGIFYSSWVYSAIRQATSITATGTPEAIALKLDLPLKDVRRALDFLLETGLCVLRDGNYVTGPLSTHVPDSSPWSRMHHRNWRDLAIQKMTTPGEGDLFFTSPLTIGTDDVVRVRELILQFIDQVNKVVDPSPSEELRCLNLDWFGVQKNRV